MSIQLAWFHFVLIDLYYCILWLNQIYLTHVLLVDIIYKILHVIFKRMKRCLIICMHFYALMQEFLQIRFIEIEMMGQGVYVGLIFNNALPLFPLPPGGKFLEASTYLTLFTSFFPAPGIVADTNKFWLNQWINKWSVEEEKYHVGFRSPALVYMRITCFLLKMQILCRYSNWVCLRLSPGFVIVNNHSVVLTWRAQGPHFDKHFRCWTCKTFDLKLPTRLIKGNREITGGQHLEDQSFLPWLPRAVMT